MTTIVTLALEELVQQLLDAERKAYFPPALNFIPAHLSLFHSLPGDAATRHVLQAAATTQVPFSLRMDGLRSMGRGVMYTFASAELQALHLRLSASFRPFLIPQDKQPLKPHVVVQNKVEPAEAKLLLAQLQAAFIPRDVPAVGLEWWEYCGGPWRPLQRFTFGGSPAGQEMPLG